MTYPHINVEEMFDLLVSEYPCGLVLKEVLKERMPGSPNSLNADYLFHSEKVIGKLKCLTEDNTFSDNNRAKVIVLANDGMVSMPPVAFVHATQQILARHFSEINYFSFLTANLFTKMRGTREECKS